MKEYNDYIRATRSYLRAYNQLRAKAENLKDDIESLKTEMAYDVAAPVSRYGNMPGGGTHELDSVEAAAVRHEKMENRIIENQRIIDKIEHLLRKVDRAFNTLTPDEQRLVYDGEIMGRGKNWGQVAMDNYISKNWARNKASRAVKKIAWKLFNVSPEQLELPFEFFNASPVDNFTPKIAGKIQA